MPRLALLRDGTAVGCFTLRHHETHVVIVEPNGHAFSHVGPCGRPSRHLTPTLLSTQRKLVAEIMQFRNRYAWCTVRNGGDAVPLLPYVHTALGDRTHMRRVRRRCGDALTVGWPRTTSYSAQALWNDGEQLFEIESLDGAARVQLHGSGKVGYAIYLVEHKSESQPAAGSNRVEFVWVHQTFPVGLAPDCFAFPVQLLLHARIARGSGGDCFSVDSDARVCAPTAFALPRNSAILDVRPTFRSLHNEHGVAAHTLDTLSAAAISQWVKGRSKSLDRMVVAERADGVDYIVGNDDVTPTVLILSSADAAESDRSLIECDRGFFRAFDSTGILTQQFTAETIPLELVTLHRDFQRTTAILLHAAALFDTSCRVNLHVPSPPVAATEDESAATLIEDLSNGLGRFRAFSDGRVRVVFADRTILQVSPSTFADACGFTYRDGSTGRCTSDSASPLQQQYLRVAMDFAQWAFATPEQRFRRHQLQLEQQSLVAKELHKITIRQELNSVSVMTRLSATNRTDNLRRVMADATSWCTSGTTPVALSPDAVAQLQRETQLHMTNVQTLLDETHQD